jgi:Ca2+-binding RTX toxin-like protein
MLLRTSPAKRRCVWLALAVLAAMVLPSTPALAAQCSFDAGTHTLSVTSDDVEGVKVESVAGDLEINDVVCATIADIDTVAIDMAGIGTLDMRLDGGPMGPGFTDEGDGSSELEFDVVGVNDDMAVQFFGSSVADGLSAGQRTTVDGVVREIDMNVLDELGEEDVDVVVHGTPGAISFRGESGDDELIGTGTGTAGSEPLASTMNIDDGDGSDLLIGGDGSDTIIVDLHDVGADTAVGGLGYDVVGVFALAGQDNNVTLDNFNNDGTACALGLCDDDNIASDFEVVAGFSADDRIVGGPGDQLLFGQWGNDQLYGSTGDDELFGDADDDLLAGGEGDDVLWDGLGADVFLGGAGFDTVDFSRRAFGVPVSLDGLPNDGSAGEGDNVDTDIERLIGTGLLDQFEGAPGRQVLIGGGGDDIIDGGPGADLIRGGPGDDSIFGADGADMLVGGTGGDWLLGGDGIDTVSYGASAFAVRVTIDPLRNDGTQGEHDKVYPSVERVIGSRFDDRLLGNHRSNVLRGADGDDILRGFGGPDDLAGGRGDDTIDGGLGTDHCLQGPGAGAKIACES